MVVSTAVEGAAPGPEVTHRMRADRVLSNRMRSYFVRRYGEGMEQAPMVLWAIVQEHTALELGADLSAVGWRVDELLESVRYVGDESPAETAALAQAWAVLSRIVAGEPQSSRGVREALAGVIDLLELTRMRCEQLQERARPLTPREERRYREELKAEGFDVAPYRGADEVCFRGVPAMGIYPRPARPESCPRCGEREFSAGKESWGCDSCGHSEPWEVRRG